MNGGMRMPDYKDTIILKQPANTEGQMWKTALPLGNGITGALVYGAISEETIIITRHDLWRDRRYNKPLPDISNLLGEARHLLDIGDYPAANALMEDKLAQLGYNSDVPTAFPLGSLSLKYKFNTGMFKGYRRGLVMDTGEAFVNWKSFDKIFERKSFVSRADGIFYTRIKSGIKGRHELSFGFCDQGNEGSRSFHKTMIPTLKMMIKDEILYFLPKAGNNLYGALISVTVHDKGSLIAEENHFIIDSADFTIKLLSFTGLHAECDLAPLVSALKSAPSYFEALKVHSQFHRALYSKATIRLSKDNDPNYKKSNEELLAQAYENVAPAVLYEKLWKFGRYLFISGTASNSNPFSLYGIWSGDYELPWNQNVCNQNIEMIYWHILTGNLAEAMRPMIHYYCRRIASFQNNAKKLFGCRGIYVPTYTAPKTMNGEDIAPPVPCVAVVLNWISAAGWLSHQFYQYYQYTNDDELMQEMILPFMIETARFYADYVVYDSEGKLRIYPSVSPENTPKNFLSDDCAGEDYLPNPVAENATMDFAILRSLLNNLYTIAKSGIFELGVPKEEIDGWHKLLRAIPAYKINEDGALKEWISDTLQDNYFHRHFSHIFPMFPGDEIDPMKSSKLSRAVRQAVNLRESDSQSGWAFAHSACIFARMQEGGRALHSLDMMAKSCLLPNFLTLHNDWRHMGVSMYLDKMSAPIQLDALMGSMNALQEMLFQYRQNRLTILPACPKRFKEIKVCGFKFPGGEISLSLQNSLLEYSVSLERDLLLEIVLPSRCFVLNGKAGENYSYDEFI